MAGTYIRGSRRIRVNCVCSATINTRVLHWAARLSPDPESAIGACNRVRALGRNGNPEEVADMVLYFVSPTSSFIAGVALVVDGGRLVPSGMGLGEGDTGANPRK